MFCVEFLVTVFHCPQTTALPQAFLSYLIPSYGAVSYAVMRDGWFLIMRRLFRIGWASLRSPGLEPYARLKLIMRYGLMTETGCFS